MIKKHLPSIALFFCAIASPVSAQYSWAYYPATDHWYAFTSSAGSWAEAQAEAESIGGYLTTLNDAPEDNWVWTNLVSSIPNAGAWHGLYQDLDDPLYSEPSGGWKWANGEPLVYSGWGPGWPDNAWGLQHWARFGAYSSGWDDDYGYMDYFGIIEMNSDPTSLLLTVTNFVAGKIAHIEIRGANSGDMISLGYSLTGGGPVSQPGLGMVDLSKPIAQLATLTADANGEARFTQSLSLTWVGAPIWMDAVNVANGTSSPGVALVVK